MKNLLLLVCDQEQKIATMKLGYNKEIMLYFLVPSKHFTCRTQILWQISGSYKQKWPVSSRFVMARINYICISLNVCYASLYLATETNLFQHLFNDISTFNKYSILHLFNTKYITHGFFVFAL